MSNSIQFTTNIGSLSIPNCIMNASGPICSSWEELEALQNANSTGAVVTKSATLEAREGNAEPRWACVAAGGGIQSMGLPNEGYLNYLHYAKELKTKGSSKPVIASVSGLKLQDNLIMIQAFLDVGVEEGGVDAIELNLSCPNIEGKPQVGYDFQQTSDVLLAVSQLPGILDRPFGLKLPPYFDDSHFDEMHRIICEANATHNDRFINFITTINSVGNTLVIDVENETPVIKPKQGHGGLCGMMVKPIGLSNVRNFRKRFGNQMGIIGVGGIEHGKDAYEYFLVGADAVQIGSQAQKEGPDVFDRLTRELGEFMKHKGVDNVLEIRNRMKYL